MLSAVLAQGIERLEQYCKLVNKCPNFVVSWKNLALLYGKLKKGNKNNKVVCGILKKAGICTKNYKKMIDGQVEKYNGLKEFIEFNEMYCLYNDWKDVQEHLKPAFDSKDSC